MKLTFAIRRPSIPSVRSIHLGLRSQIMMLGLAGVVIIGTFYLLGRQFEHRSRLTEEKFATLTTLTSKLSESLLQARQVATEFLQKPNDKKTALHEQILKSAADYLARIEPMVEALPDKDPLRDASAFRPGINSYTTRFANVVTAQKLIGYTENDGLQGKLRTAVHSVEDKLKKFDQPRLAVLMLMMRRHEKDFMLRGDEKYGDELDKRYDEFIAQLAKTDDLPDDTRKEIKSLLQAYRQSFIGYEAGQTTLNEEAADLAQIYDRLRPTLSEVRKAADERLEVVRAEAKAVQQAIFWAICVTMAMVAVAALLFGRYLSQPLVKMTTAMQDLAQGNVDTTVVRFNRRDEIGVISRALSVFHEKLLENRKLTQDQVRMQQEAETERKVAMRRIADGFEHTVGRIIETVSSASSEIELAAGSLTRTAEVTQGLSATVAAASDQSSASVRSAAAASEQMAVSVTEIGGKVRESHKVAHAAVQQAEQTNARIAELSQSAGRIGEVIKIITAVAEQTNLLALNATIEAARAGDAGRGFAVVASEVKALAAQTAKATDEIGAQIAQMRTATQHSVAAIKEIGGTISQISEIASAIAAAVEQQGAATQKIAQNVQQAAQGATQVTSSITDVNRGATDTGAAAGQVHTLASSLVSESNTLKTEVENFLATVRAA
jgi:methyl-accepting chemotaxis protein